LSPGGEQVRHAADGQRARGDLDRGRSRRRTAQRGAGLSMRSSVQRTPRFLASEASLLYRRLRPARPGTARIIYYHRIDREEHRSCVAPEAFAAQMALLRSEGWNVLSLGEVAGHLAARESFPERAVAVTLDDGFEDNYTAGFPVLARE